MIDHIDLTKAKLDKLKSNDLIAITMASGGAMGDPGAIELVGKDLKVYYTHFGDFDNKKLEKVIPFLNTLDVMFDTIKGLSDDWTGLYTGYGNYLFVRPELKAPIKKYIEENYSDSEVGPIVELYSHWYDALKEAVRANEKIDKEVEAKIKEFRQIWQDFFEDLTAEMSQERKDFVKTKKGRAKFMHWYYEGDHDEYPWAFFTEENMK